MKKDNNSKSTGKIHVKSSVSLYAPVLIFIVILVVGCGKKGPPVSPMALPPPAVTDLKARVSGDSLELTWSVTEEKGFSEPDGYIVYRSKKSIGEADCKDCPEVFENVAKIPVTQGFFASKKNTGKYREPSETDKVYRYKVTAYSANGLFGEPSEIVQVSP